MATKVTPVEARRAPASAGDYWFTRLSKPLIFLILALAVMGVYVAFTIPVAVFPEVDFPRIVIGIDNGVMPIDQMMVTITRPLENAVNSVPGLLRVNSITSRGSAEVDLFFNWNVDMVQTLQLVNAAVAQTQASLPTTAKIDSHRLTFASFPILGFSLTSDTVSQSQLWELATYTIKPQINRLEGVATVTVQGGSEPEYLITPDPAKLLTASVTIEDILNAVTKTNLVDSPGLIEANHQLYLDLVNGQVKNPEELGQIVIKTNAAGIPVHIGDVATVSNGTKPKYTVATANGKPAVLLSINRQPDSNTVVVADQVNAKIADLRQALPPAIKLQPYYDQSGLVRDAIASVRDAILIGLVLAAIVIVAFLRDWGSSAVAGMVIPITIVITFIILKILGESFNLMTLGGLAAAVGLVIDDAIVVIENIVLHRDLGQGRFQAVSSALNEVTSPLIGSTVTPIVVFLPLVAIHGVYGTFFRALAVTMGVSLFTSLALALTWTPNLSQYFVRRNSQQEVDEGTTAEWSERERLEHMIEAEESSYGRYFRAVVNFYEGWLRRALERPLLLAAGSVLLVIAAYICYRSLGTDLLPAMDEGGFVLDYFMPPGSSLSETNRVVNHVAQIISSEPEVESTSRRTGMQLGLAAVTEANTGDISVKLKSGHKRSSDDVIADLRVKIKQAEPELDTEFTQLLQDMIGDLTSAPEPAVIKLFTEDANLLAKTGPQVADAISQIKGVVDIKNGVEEATSGPAVNYQIDPAVTARAGFSPDEVAVDAAAILEGEPATNPVVVSDRAYTVRVRFPDASRVNIQAMNNTLLASSSGHTASLGSLASVSELPGQMEIRRENLQRDLEVTARFEGLDLGTGMAKVKEAISKLHLPPSIHIEYGGLYADQQQTFHDFVFVFVMAFAFVFATLLFEFRSFSAPTAILASALLSTAGVFLALLVTGTTFSVSAFMGLIMVIGIVAKNGILLLDAEQEFRRAGFAREESMMRAGRRRLRPIAMTAIAAVAGMLPLAFAIGAGSEMLQPLAIAVIGGILISMVLSLLVTPAVYFYLTGLYHQDLVRSSSNFRGGRDQSVEIS
ncbi:MAG: efflux RND transporter permease subunit [Acidobacteria bacterium]|nr:efflux RND transporter permease subunit [Acidobacteriota bacterium]